MAKPKEESDIKQLQTKEQDITNVIVQIRLKEEEMAKLEKEINVFLKQCQDEAAKELASNDPRLKENREERKKRLNEFHAEEVNLEKSYWEMVACRDGLMRDLRGLYKKVIQTAHPEPKKDGKDRKSKVEVKDKELDTSLKVSLNKSSLKIGTSYGSIDDVDYNKYFRTGWDIDCSKVKQHRIKEHTVIPHFSQGYISIVHGAKLFIKEYLDPPKTKEEKEDKEDHHKKVMNTLSEHYGAMKKISHPNLITPVGRWGSTKSWPMRILLELGSFQEYPDPSLRGLLFGKDRTKLSIVRKIEIVRNTLGAVSWLHVSGKAHGRLKPSNVLLMRDKRAKVTDYGLGLPWYFEEVEKNHEHWFRTQQIHFTAPEILKEEADKVSENKLIKGDIWSFGLLLYCIFTEKEPWLLPNAKGEASPPSDYKSVLDIIHKQGLPDYKVIKSPTLQYVFAHCLDMDPAKRTPLDQIALKYYNEKVDKNKIKTFSEDLLWDRISYELLSGNDEINEVLHQAQKNCQERSDKSTKEKKVLPPAPGKEFAWADLRLLLKFPSLTDPPPPIPTDELCVLFTLGIEISQLEVLVKLPPAEQYEFRLDGKFTSKIFSIHACSLNEFPEYSKKLARSPWFYGLVETNDMTGLMNAAKDEKKTTNVIGVRISKNVFAFVYSDIEKDDKNWSKKQVDLKEYTNVKNGIIGYIEGPGPKKLQPHSKETKYHYYDYSRKSTLLAPKKEKSGLLKFR